MKIIETNWRKSGQFALMAVEALSLAVKNHNSLIKINGPSGYFSITYKHKRKKLKKTKKVK